MKAYCISDNNDTMLGMRLAGIEGIVLHDGEAVEKKLTELLENEEIAVILMTTKIVNMLPEVIANYKLTMMRPLIVEIPDRHGSDDIGKNIDAYISEAIGIKL